MNNEEALELALKINQLYGDYKCGPNAVVHHLEIMLNAAKEVKEEMEKNHD